MSNLSNYDIAEGFYNQTGDIPWVIAKQMFKSMKSFPIDQVLKGKTAPDIIAELIAYFGKSTRGDDGAICCVVENEDLTNETKLELCIMLIES